MITAIIYLVVEISRIYLDSLRTDFMINKKCLHSVSKVAYQSLYLHYLYRKLWEKEL